VGFVGNWAGVEPEIGFKVAKVADLSRLMLDGGILEASVEFFSSVSDMAVLADFFIVMSVVSDCGALRWCDHMTVNSFSETSVAASFLLHKPGVVRAYVPSNDPVEGLAYQFWLDILRDALLTEVASGAELMEDILLEGAFDWVSGFSRVSFLFASFAS
jgi:hypothetical protein